MGYVWFVKKLKSCCVWFGTYKKRFVIRDPELLNSIPDLTIQCYLKYCRSARSTFFCNNQQFLAEPEVFIFMTRVLGWAFFNRFHATGLFLYPMETGCLIINGNEFYYYPTADLVKKERENVTSLFLALSQLK